MSMNLAFGYPGQKGLGNWLDGLKNTSTYLTYTKESSLTRPGPANTWLFVDEHPDSINDGAFAVFKCPGANGTPINFTAYVDLPAKYHGNACGFSFADGWPCGDS